MKILVVSRYFYPSLGGSETDAEIFARQFSHLGHEVRVVTETPLANLHESDHDFPFTIVRKPTSVELIRQVSWCDVCFHNGISLRSAWPLLLLRKPWVIRHQGWLRTIDGSVNEIGGSDKGLLVQLKYRIARFATSISISNAIAERLPFPSTMIHNPYRDDLFLQLPEVPRTKELVYLGRLVSEKGVHILLEALSKLKHKGLTPSLTIIGSGSEEQILRQQTSDLAIEEQVDFVGPKVGNELVQALNAHEVMVVPSLYHEPLGVVALEGIACGCVVVGSSGGGLKEAIGPCGVTFPNGDVDALADALTKILQNPGELNNYRQNAEAHLALHKQADVSLRYVEVMEKSLL